MIFTDFDIRLTAKCIWCEDRGGGSEGMRAIAHVIVNRVKSPDFPKTIREVIYQANAFSWTRPDNPEYGLDPGKSTGADLAAYQEADRLAGLVLSGTDADLTLGACFYENPKNVSPNSWFGRHIVGDPVNHPFLVAIGSHNFYR